MQIHEICKVFLTLGNWGYLPGQLWFGLYMHAELKITTGRWPFSDQNCQMANHFPKLLAVSANHQYKNCEGIMNMHGRSLAGSNI